MKDERCTPGDPNRCQGITNDGQCRYLAVGASKYCDFHSHGTASRNEEKKELYSYFIQNKEINASFQRRLKDQNYLDLREDIQLTRALLERRLNLAKTFSEEIAAIKDVQGLILRLESMSISLQKLQQQLGLVLGKDQLRVFAKELALILKDELNDVKDRDQIIDRICERVFGALETAGRQEEN